MRHTLYGKLAAILLGLMLLVGVAFVSLTVLTTQYYLEEINQKLHRPLAQHIVEDEWLMRDGQVNEKALDSVFDKLMAVNPSIEVYLVDTGGEILSYSAPSGKVKRDRIHLAPVNDFIESDAGLPLYGDDPREVGGQKVFSAAPVYDGDKRAGYLYIVLGGELYDSVVQRLQGSYILRLSLGVGVAVLVVSLLVGFWAFRRLTRRLHHLNEAMDRFRESEFQEPVRVPGSSNPGDEVDGLAETFQAMATRMTEQIHQLKNVDANRRELVANVSHDLRTPLASLQGYLETLMLKEQALSANERRSYLETALTHTQRLSRLVSELFELATLGTGDARLRVEPFSLSELAQDVAQKFALHAERKGVHLDVDIPPATSMVQGDIALIERVLDNLLDNAIKYTPRAGTVGLGLRETDGAVALWVTDTGPGIPEEELPSVFERFYRGGRQYPKRPDGTGLGLAIAKRILELHGVGLEAHSELGKGTSFAFSLPTAAA